MTSQATLRAAVNGGSPSVGHVLASAGDTIQLSRAAADGVRTCRYEIYSYPVTFHCPQGWTNVAGVYTYTGEAPPAFDLTEWGKYLPRLRLNGVSDTDATGQLDATMGLEVISTYGLRDLAKYEVDQFGGTAQSLQQTLRAVETVTASVVAGGLVHATHAAFRAAAAPPNGTFFKILSPPGEYQYSTTSGAGWADDDDTILKPTAVDVSANGRAFSTRASEHAATFAAARAMVGLLGRAKHVHIESHTTFGDGGGGIFDVKAVGAYVDNNGTFIVAGSAALVRRGYALGPVNARWFGCQCDWSFSGQTGTDDTANFFAALEYANGLAAGAMSAGTVGDTTRNLARRTRPLLVDGPTRLTAPIPVRYCNVRIVGTGGAQEGAVSGMCGALVFDHAGYGLVIDVGTTTPWMPSLALHNISSIRSTARHALGKSALRLTGSNWFKGLELVNCTLSGGESAMTIDASYTLGYASGLLIENVMCVGHTGYGFDGNIFWDLSSINHLDCKQNALGPYRIKIRSCRMGAVDIEDGGAGGVLTMWSSSVEGHYTEGTTPLTSPALTVAALHSAIGPMHNGGGGRLFNYELVNSLYSSVKDRAPVRTVTSHAIDMACDIYPPQVYTDNVCYLTHTVSRGRNLARSRSLKGALNPKVLKTASYANKTFVDGVLLPTFEIGTVGVPASRGGVVFIEQLTAGHIYVIAYTLTYTGTVPTQSTDHLLTDHLLVWDSGGTISELTGNGLDEVELNGTRQVVFCICPQTTHPDFGMWIYPFGPNASYTGYGCQLSEVYLAELPAGAAIPSMHVPTLLLGQPFNGSGTMNGATGVAFSDTAVKATSRIDLMRTTLAGTPGPHSVTIVPGTGFTVYGGAADIGSAFTVERH